MKAGCETRRERSVSRRRVPSPTSTDVAASKADKRYRSSSRNEEAPRRKSNDAAKDTSSVKSRIENTSCSDAATDRKEDGRNRAKSSTQHTSQMRGRSPNASSDAIATRTEVSLQKGDAKRQRRSPSGKCGRSQLDLELEGSGTMKRRKGDDKTTARGRSVSRNRDAVSDKSAAAAKDVKIKSGRERQTVAEKTTCSDSRNRETPADKSTVTSKDEAWKSEREIAAEKAACSVIGNAASMSKVATKGTTMKSEREVAAEKAAGGLATR